MYVRSPYTNIQSSQFDTDEHAELVFELVFSGLIESLEAPLPLRVFIVL
jgi:hypothetical protein